MSLVVPGGEVLDLACGGGRHARHLASLGLKVEAVDRDAAAVEALAHVAGVHARCADLEDGPWPYGGRTFDGIVVTNYLHRPLFPLLRQSLREGAVLIYETFMCGNERFGRPSNPDFLLQPDELLTAFADGMCIVAFEQGQVTRPKPAAIQRICVVRAADAAALMLPE